jgi:spore germination protein YaaH
MPNRLTAARQFWPVTAAVPAVLLLVWLAMAVPMGPRPALPAGADRSTPAPAGPPVRPKLVAYVPYWDQQRGFASLSHNLRMFDEVSPLWYAPAPDGAVLLADPQHTTVDLPTVRMLQRRGIKVLPTVSNLQDQDVPPSRVGQLLHDPATVRRHVRELVALAVGNGYDGIDVDYESLRAIDRAAYSAFLGALSAALHAHAKLLTTSVHPKISDAGYDQRNQAQDFRAIGAVSDEVRVMAYDYHWGTSPPGAIAPAGWVEAVVAWTVSQVPREKVVLGSVLLGYDWVGRAGTTIDHQTACALAAAHHATVRRADDESPWFTYRDAGGWPHTVWWEDASSVAVKLKVAGKYGLGGVFFWRLGGEDAAVWPTVRAWRRAHTTALTGGPTSGPTAAEHPTPQPTR